MAVNSNPILGPATKMETAVKNLETGRWPLTVETLLRLIGIAEREGRDPADFADGIRAAFDRANDDTLGLLAVNTRAKIERDTLRVRWIQQQADAALFNRAVSRREGDESAKVSIPHEHADIELIPEFSSYVFDVDALETVLPYLKEQERSKLLKIEPERTEFVLPLSAAQAMGIRSAITLLESLDASQHPNGNVIETIDRLTSLLASRTIPRRVSAGATISIISIADRYRGSNVETLIRGAMKRDKIRDVLKITPRAVAEVPKDVTP